MKNTFQFEILRCFLQGSAESKRSVRERHSSFVCLILKALAILGLASHGSVSAAAVIPPSESSATARSPRPSSIASFREKGITPPQLLTQVRRPGPAQIPSQKLYLGLDSDPDMCDTTAARGWFYWYMDALGQCYVVPVASREEADRQAYELVIESFHVVVSGYGLRDSTGNPIDNLPPLR